MTSDTLTHLACSRAPPEGPTPSGYLPPAQGGGYIGSYLASPFWGENRTPRPVNLHISMWAPVIRWFE